MTVEFYQLALTDRRRMLADAGFVRDDLRIWAHPDGHSIGEGVAAALTDQAFLKFLNSEQQLRHDRSGEVSQQAARVNAR
ncbi:MAG: hypothetical protein M3X11_10315 [Acidobacteriota bacterium]|nr:hypothetical protein [Acidobacteriota bacterium]